MNALRLFLIGAVMGVWALSQTAQAQCTETLEFSADLVGEESYTDSIFLVGDLNTLTVNLDVVTSGGSYPGDLMVYLYAPNGECVVWGGWNVDPDPGCTDIGTGTGGAWPLGWNSSVDGFYTATFDFSALGLGGGGAWVVTVVNAYTSSTGSDGDYEFVFEGPCAGDCNIEGACNYNPDGLNPNEDVCWWPEDVYGVGYDCDGNCLVDEDGDAICDETDPCVGEYDECQVCNGPGAIYECGCYDIPETDCDCNGNQLDALGVCGGTCAADEDGDGICDACIPPDGYWLEVETVMEHTEDTLAGMTTYRVHLVCQTASDYMYSMSGSALFPLSLNSTSGSWYNHPANASWNPSGLDVALLDEEPFLAYDSFLTIGSENSEGGPFPGAVWSAGDPRPEFQPGEGNNVTVNSGNGLNYLIFPGMGQVNTHPGFAGDDFRILVMQMTTEGDIYGQMNIQVYPGGQSANAITTLLEFDSSSLCYDLDPCVGEYDECGVCAGPGAVYECGCSGPEEGFCDCDGNVLDAAGVCGGDCVEDLDGDGVCDVDEILGCDDEVACNFSMDATENDGSCTYAEEFYDCDGMCLMDMDGDGVCDELEVAGCMDEMACNYDPTATDDDMSCTYAADFYDCDGYCLEDIDGDGTCDELEVDGCTDEMACNYDPTATEDDMSCTYAADFYDCNGNCLEDSDGDGTCDELEVDGCTDEMACNYDPTATEDDMSCTYAADFYDCDGNCLEDSDGDGTCDELEVDGCTDEMACNYNEAATDSDGSCDFECIGCTDPSAVNYEPDNTIEDGSCIYFEASCSFLGSSEWQNLGLGIHAENALVHTFASDVVQEVVLNLPALIQEPTSGSNFSVMEWTDLAVSGMPNGLAFDSLPTTALGNTQTCVTYSGMLLETGLFTVTLTGNLVLSVFGNPYPIGPYASTFDVEVLADPNPIPGCTYPLATNFLSFANEDDGSCLFLGCTNPEAVNFQVFATVDDGSCDFTPCASSCPSDLDGDGVTGTPDLLFFLSSFGLNCPN